MGQISVYIKSSQVLKKIDKRIKEIGCGATRSGWIEQACVKQLKQEMGLRYLKAV